VDLEADIDVACEGIDGLPLGLVGKAAEALRIERRELVRDVHEAGQLLGAEPCRRSRQLERVFPERGRSGRKRRHRTVEVQRLGGGDDGQHRRRVAGGGGGVKRQTSAGIPQYPPALAVKVPFTPPSLETAVEWR
jgi:hypothetical protein